MKEEALERTLWRTRYGRGTELVRHTTEKIKINTFWNALKKIPSNKNNKSCGVNITYKFVHLGQCFTKQRKKQCLLIYDRHMLEGH